MPDDAGGWRGGPRGGPPAAAPVENGGRRRLARRAAPGAGPAHQAARRQLGLYPQPAAPRRGGAGRWLALLGDPRPNQGASAHHRVQKRARRQGARLLPDRRPPRAGAHPMAAMAAVPGLALSDRRRCAARSGRQRRLAGRQIGGDAGTSARRAARPRIAVRAPDPAAADFLFILCWTEWRRAPILTIRLGPSRLTAIRVRRERGISRSSRWSWARLGMRPC